VDSATLGGLWSGSSPYVHAVVDDMPDFCKRDSHITSLKLPLLPGNLKLHWKHFGESLLPHAAMPHALLTVFLGILQNSPRASAHRLTRCGSGWRSANPINSLPFVWVCDK